MAGCAVAKRMSARGLRVALVGLAPRAGWEGVSARSRALLLEEGLDGGEGLMGDPFPRRGCWADREIAGQEWLVERTRLAQSLRVRALEFGVVGYADLAANTAGDGNGWRIRLRAGTTLRAPTLVDARGRRGAERRGPLLIGFGQRFRRRHASPEETRIEAADSAWCWWAAQGSSVWVQIIGRRRSGHPSHWLAAVCGQIPSLARVLKDSIRAGEPIARAAHARLGAGSMVPNSWKVGDAAMALDPLSGQGIYQSLRSARLVSTAVLSVWHGSEPQLARRFVAERHEEAFERGMGIAAGFYRANAGRSEFWEQTAAAYEALLRRAGQRGVESRIERRAVLIDDRIVEREVIVSAGHPRGVWQVSGVPLAELVRHLRTTAGATAASAAASLGRPTQAVASAIRWLREARPESTQGHSNLNPGG